MIQEPRKFRKGDLREDGYIFSAYNKRNGKIREVWLSPQAYERSIQSNKDWKAKNQDRHREHSKASGRKYRSTEKYSNTNSARKLANVETIAKKRSEYWEKNKATLSTRRKEWGQKNRGRVAQYAAERRALRSGLTPDLDPQQRGIMVSLYRLANRVTRCLGISHHVDHIAPLKPRTGAPGLHTPSNLQVIPARTNLKKNNKVI